MDWDSRYSKHYRETCRITHRSTGGVCCCCFQRPSETVHHVRYRDEHGSNAGRELPGFDVFPLCNECHTLSHDPKNWIKSKSNPLLENRNTAEWIERLKFGFQILNLNTGGRNAERSRLLTQ